MVTKLRTLAILGILCVISAGAFQASAVRRDLGIEPLLVTLPTGIHAGDSCVGTVTVNKRGSTNTVVTLASSDTTKLTVPSTVTVHSGNLTATFNCTAVAAASSVSVTATANSATATGSMVIQ